MAWPRWKSYFDLRIISGDGKITDVLVWLSNIGGATASRLPTVLLFLSPSTKIQPVPDVHGNGNLAHNNRDTTNVIGMLIYKEVNIQN